MRRLLRAVPLVWWLVALGLGLATLTTTAGALRSADAARQRWGAQATVAVVQREVAAGQPVASGDVDLAVVPAGLVPDGALADRAVGRVALVALAPGEILVDRRLAGSGRSGPAALLERGERGVTITALSGERPPLAVGDRVDLLAVPADGSPGHRLAGGRLVIDVEPETGAVTVAVTAAVAVTVAEALERGRVVLALSP